MQFIKDRESDNKFIVNDFYPFNSLKSGVVGNVDFSDILFSFKNLFWPEFLNIEGFYFLKEVYSKNRFDELVGKNENPEYWLNMLMVDGYFEGLDNWREVSFNFSKDLASVWSSKLKSDFPLLNFQVEQLYDHECGDYGLTFFETKKSINRDLNNG